MKKYAFVFKVELEVEADSLDSAGLEIDGMLVNAPISGNKTWDELDILGYETLNSVGEIIITEEEALEAILNDEAIKPWASDEDGNGRWVRLLEKYRWPNVYQSRHEGIAYPVEPLAEGTVKDTY